MANEFRVKNGIISPNIGTDSGDFTIDSAGDIIFDADGTDITLKDGGTAFGSFKRASSDFIIKAEDADNDIIFKGIDGSSVISALTLDMSEAGAASFNSGVTIGGNLTIPDDIVHSGDTNNLISFGTDTQSFETGGSSRMDISDSGVRLGGANSRVTTILDENNMASDSATALATQQSIKAYVDDSVGSAGGGDITAVTAGVGLSGGGTTGGVTLTLDMSELTDMTADVTDNADEFILLDNGSDRRKMMNEIDVGGFRDVITGPFHFETDQENVALGEGALDSLTQYVSGLVANGGNNNTAIGENAGTAVSTGDSNTLLGHDAGETITTGSSNTVVGAGAEPSAVDASNQIVIGSGAVGLADNAVVIGNTSITAWLPPDDAGVDLGSSSYQFKDAYIHGTLEADAITIGGTNVVSGSLITTLGTISAGTWQGTAIASAYLDSDTAHLSGTQTFTGAKSFDENATLAGFVLDGNTITGVDDSGEFTDDDAHIMTSAGINDKFGVIAGSSSIVTVGTIGTGTWQGTAIASAYLDSDTAHLSGTQTFSGNKTFSGSITLGGHAVNDIDVAGEFVDSDEHLMTSAAINDRIAAAGGASDLDGLSDANVTDTNNIGLGSGALDSVTASGSWNVALGQNAGTAITSGAANIAIGHNTLQGQVSDVSSTAVGYNSMYSATSSHSVAIGRDTLRSATADYVVAIGNNSMYALTSGAGNTGIGFNTGRYLTDGNRNTLIGYQAGDGFDSESDNIAIGYDALGGSVAGGEYNVSIGNYSLDALTSADYNVAIGHNAGTLIQDGGSNVVIGAEAAGNGDIGANNVLVGMQSGYGSTDATQSVAIGNDAGKFGLKAATGSIAMGQNALKGHSSNTTGANYNTALGHYSMEDVTTGDDNTAIGSYALTNITTGTANIAIGHDAGDNITTGSRCLVIGGLDTDSVSQDDAIRIGNGTGSVTWINGDQNGIRALKIKVQTVTGAHTLTDAQSGSYVYCTGSGVPTLPASAESGQQYTIINNTGGNLSVQTNSNTMIPTSHGAMSNQTARTYVAVASGTWFHIG